MPLGHQHKATPRAPPIRERGFLKARKILICLGAKLDLLDPFPEKPPRMHWPTCERLYHTHGIASACAMSATAIIIALATESAFVAAKSMQTIRKPMTT